MRARNRLVMVFICSLFAFSFLGCQKVADKQTSTTTHKDPTQPFAGDSTQTAPPTSTIPIPRPRPKPGDPTNPVPVIYSQYCHPDKKGKLSFDTKMTGGNGSDAEFGGYDYGQGGGCIARGIKDVWATSMNQDLMIWNDTRGDGYSLLTPPRGILRLFDVHYHVTSYFLGLPITVTWKMHWYHSIPEGGGTPAQPLKVLINYNRYEGTSHIAYWQGTIELSRVSDQITGVWIRNQIRADRTGVDGAESGASDIISKLRHGQPDWRYMP